MARLRSRRRLRRTRRARRDRHGERDRPAPHAAREPAHRRRSDPARAPPPPRRSAGGSCCCATSPARWSPTRAPTCSSSPAPPAAAAPDLTAEAFVFATRLTRLTRALHSRNPERAIQRAAAAAPDWSSGTRIGDALKTFNDRHGRRGMARGAVIVILSDGWERGDPALVGAGDGAPVAARPPDRLGQPARRRAPASSHAPAGWPRRCRTATRSSAATASRRSTRSIDAIAAPRAGDLGRRRPWTPPTPPDEPEEEPWASADAGPPAARSRCRAATGPSRGNTTPGWSDADERRSTRRSASTRAASAPRCRRTRSAVRSRRSATWRSTTR